MNHVTFFSDLPCPSARNYCFIAKPVIRVASPEDFESADDGDFMVRCWTLKWPKCSYLFPYSFVLSSL